jgi:hypothetical protein
MSSFVCFFLSLFPFPNSYRSVSLVLQLTSSPMSSTRSCQEGLPTVKCAVSLHQVWSVRGPPVKP